MTQPQLEDNLYYISLQNVSIYGISFIERRLKYLPLISDFHEMSYIYFTSIHNNIVNKVNNKKMNMNDI